MILDRYEDLALVGPYELNNIEFVVFKGDANALAVCDRRFTFKYIFSRDEMKDFRYTIKTTYNYSYLGHVFTLYICPATYSLLDEWLVYDINEINTVVSANVIFFDPPHVIVFDMDSTLITDEENVRIRDVAIYKALNELKTLNCVLCLWSYGNREHVTYSLDKVNLNGYFDIILSEGKLIGEYNLREEEDRRFDVFYKSTPFYLNVTDKKNIPKSPRVVLWYLQQYNVVYFKTITLVDDLVHNNIHYDNFVNLTKCPVPKKDWNVWQSKIVNYIVNYDKKFTIGEFENTSFDITKNKIKYNVNRYM
nr:38K [Darna trima granulovirus]